MVIYAVINTHERTVLGWRMLPLAICGLLLQTHEEWAGVVMYDPGTPEGIHVEALREAVAIASSITRREEWEPVAKRIRRVECVSRMLWDKRNAGLDLAAESGADIAVQIDDDDIYCQDYLSKLSHHYESNPKYRLVNVQRVNCYDMSHRKRGIDGQNGSALHSCRTDYAGRYRYKQWRSSGHGEDTAYNIQVLSDGILETHRMTPDPVGDEIIVCRYGIGHTWPWSGSHVMRTPDPTGEWLASRIGRDLADRYLNLLPWFTERDRDHGRAGGCGGCTHRVSRWGFSICTANGMPESLPLALSARCVIRNMSECPAGSWKGSSTTTRHKYEPVLYRLRRAACKKCPNYSIDEPDVGDNGRCTILCTESCAKAWRESLDGGRFPGGVGCIQSAERSDAGRVIFAGFVPPGGATGDVELDLPLAAIAGRTRLRWVRAGRVQPEPGDWFVSGNRWHPAPAVPGVRVCDWIYESIGHWGSPERYRAVYGGPIGKVQFMANPQYVERPGNVYLPNYGYYEWQMSSRPQNTGERLCVAVIANTGLYGLGVDKRQICLGIAAGGRPGEVDLVGRAFGRPVPGHWWDTPAAYARGTFAIVLENVHHPEFSAGYLTEKLFQVVLGGAIPCYLGAWDVERLVPEGCYVDLRPFVGRWGDVVPHLRVLDADGYRRRISEWMQSDVFKSRSFERCCVEIDRVLCRLTAKA